MYVTNDESSVIQRAIPHTPAHIPHHHHNPHPSTSPNPHIAYYYLRI